MSVIDIALIILHAQVIQKLFMLLPQVHDNYCTLHKDADCGSGRVEHSYGSGLSLFLFVLAGIPL